ncbi:hypothetical protein GQ43DRAFT_435578 [Delitschia confertaspora ATCC 74209]|uniref:Transaldolase n=1 Tax=Delitschia confertaspora ATCC 74209 TaxID=1513339 RepID=A0A9P4JCW0_9PLEO|nr:hypothetical protein GQ43DRAFT_435578 [Delitschia confertaspora ATCC 74209]
MGVDTRRPPLPAPTEPSTLSSVDNNITLTDDLATDVSRRTDKTSYSIPEDGTPITINTAKRELGNHRKYPSQTSLLIEYFEAGKEEGKVKSKPSVRVRVTPSHRKDKSVSAGQVKVTQTSRNKKTPSYTRRISLHGSKVRDDGTTQPTEASYSEESNVSSLPPVEVEVIQHGSELSSNGGRYIPVGSDISSMPPDSMLEGPAIIHSLVPERPRSRSLERRELDEETGDTLKAPTRQRSRSLSKERITHRVMEKLQQTPVKSGSPSTSKARDARTSREELTPSRKSRNRTSRGSREEEMSALSTESSHLSSNINRRSGDTYSMRSAVSGTSSINNPKLLATVEDAIKRLILPELNALKEEQRTQKNRSKFERLSRDSSTMDTVESSTSRETSRRRVSKSSSAPNVAKSGPQLVLNRDGDDPGTLLSGSSSRKERRSSRGSASAKSYAESTTREDEKLRRKKSKDKGHSARDVALAGLAGAGLTAAALRRHESLESHEDRKERKKKHSRSSRSRSASITESVEEASHLKELVPPMPLLPSELQGSDMTRESIRSAETETKERPDSSSSRGTGAETPLREVRRGPAFQVVTSPAPCTPTRTPLALQRSLGTLHSNRSQTDLSSKKSEQSMHSRGNYAALDAAAAAKARALESNEPPVSQYEIDRQTPTRALSPVQSEASYREELTHSPDVRSPQSPASLSSTGRKAQRQSSGLSIQSFESSPSTKGARTRKRPQGVNLESEKQALGTPEAAREAEEFFAQNHEQNELYRRQIENTSPEGTPVDEKRFTAYTDDTTEMQYHNSEEKVALGQDIRKVGSNPEYVHTPVAVESAVASLHEPGSNVSVRSSVSSPVKRGVMVSNSPLPGSPLRYSYDRQTPEQQGSDNNSQERWQAIRDKAQALAHHQQSPERRALDSPRQSISNSLDEPIEMRATAFPVGGDILPELGYGVDDESDITTNPSIIQGPLGSGHTLDHSEDDYLSEDRGHTPTYGQAVAVGVGAAAAGIAANTAARMHHQDEIQYKAYNPTVESYNNSREFDHQYDQQPIYSRQDDTTPVRSPQWKDEGYQSAHQGGVTPDQRNHSRLFDDDGLGDLDDLGAGTDMFADGKHARHFSGNSHGMSSPLYDAATGRGLDRIQSKDVVALMDHLTVRDGQRNARDTEILVTLVRSAAEMRNSFEEMKQFIRTQDAMIMNSTDKRIDLAEQRVIGGPRPLPGSSSRAIRSSTEDMDVEQKKKSVFKRALKGLSLKGDSDIKNIERMLIQLLGEVEGLKQTQALQMEQQANSHRSNSLTSYENLRASGDPGYEPEGRADTAGSPHQSGYLSNPSNPSSRRIQDMHSGYDVHQPHRISTVEEADEEYAEDDLEDQYENTERMTTPTQEARRNNAIPQETPPQASRPFRESPSQENTPKRKHKSNTSSIFGIPKISRWSKTTSSTNPETMPRNSGSSERQRPYSDASRSGSQVNVVYYGDEAYEIQPNDRLHSNATLPKQQAASVRSGTTGSLRSASPLIPEDEEPLGYVDEAKYQAHRNSLNLQHPQPRPGPTHRHQSHLESQAQIFEPVGSPDYDQWGSNPSLARNRLSGGNASQGAGNLSPISSNGDYSPEQAAPPRPPKIRDDGPLIPPQPLGSHGVTRQMYSSPNEFGSQGVLTPLAPIQEVRYSLETDTGHHYSPTPSPRPASSQNLKPMASPQRKITGPRPMGSRSPSTQSPNFDNTGTVVRRKPIAGAEPQRERERSDFESLKSYRSSDSEMF